jgi:hypothetical protein
MALYGGEGKRARSGGGDGARRPLSTASRGSCMLSRSPCFFPVSSLVSFAAAARDPRTEGGRPGRAALQSPNRVVTNGQAAAGARQLQDYKLDLGGPQKKTRISWKPTTRQLGGTTQQLTENNKSRNVNKKKIQQYITLRAKYTGGEPPKTEASRKKTKLHLDIHLLVYFTPQEHKHTVTWLCRKL